MHRHIRTRLAIGLVAAAIAAPAAHANFPHEVGPATPPTPRAIVIEDAGGFDWEAAGVGFAAAAGVVLVGGGSVVALRRRRTHDSLAH